MPLVSIKSEEHLDAAQAMIDRLMDKKKLDGGEQAYLDALSDLVVVYEDQHHPIPTASDADLWIAYTLLEAGRLWKERRYTALGTLIAVLAGDARSATLVALLTALPMIPVALVSGQGVLPMMSQVLPLTPSMSLFNDALFTAHLGMPIVQGIGHLLLLSAIFGALSFRLLRRLS